MPPTPPAVFHLEHRRHQYLARPIPSPDGSGRIEVHRDGSYLGSLLYEANGTVRDVGVGLREVEAWVRGLVPGSGSPGSDPQ